MRCIAFRDHAEVALWLQKNATELQRTDEVADIFTCSALALLLKHFEQLEESALSDLGPCFGSCTFDTSPRARMIGNIFAGHSRYPIPTAPDECTSPGDDRRWTEGAAGSSENPHPRDWNENMQEDQVPGMGAQAGLPLGVRKKLSASSDESKVLSEDETLSIALQRLVAGSLETIDEIDSEDEAALE